MFLFVLSLVKLVQKLAGLRQNSSSIILIQVYGKVYVVAVSDHKVVLDRTIILNRSYSYVSYSIFFYILKIKIYVFLYQYHLFTSSL